MFTALNHCWQEGRKMRTVAAVAEFSRSVEILGTAGYQPLPQLNAKPDTAPGAVAVKETGV